MAKRTSSFLNLDIAMFDLFTGAYGYGRKGLEKAQEAAMDIQVKSRVRSVAGCRAIHALCSW